MILAVIGCPLPELPYNSHAITKDDRLDVRCNYTREAWHLTCKDGVWIGQTGNCSTGNFHSTPKQMHDYKTTYS